MRITSGMEQRHVLADLRRVQERLSQAQNQVSSGKRIEKASDDPVGAARAERLRAGLESTTAYRSSVDDGTSWLRATDSALTSVGDIAQRARELTVQAANGATTDSGRQSIRTELDQLIDQVKATMNGAYDGRSLFAGTQTGTAPYQIGTGSPDAYQGDAGAIVREVGPGVQVKVNVTGADAVGTLLPALRDISAHLAANDTAALSGDLKTIDGAMDDLTTQRSLVGATMNRLSAAGSRLDDLHDVSTSYLSETEDADLPQALTDLSSQQNALSAALKSGASLIQPSLLDFLR